MEDTVQTPGEEPRGYLSTWRQHMTLCRPETSQVVRCEDEVRRKVLLFKEGVEPLTLPFLFYGPSPLFSPHTTLEQDPFCKSPPEGPLRTWTREPFETLERVARLPLCLRHIQRPRSPGHGTRRASSDLLSHRTSGTRVCGTIHCISETVLFPLSDRGRSSPSHNEVISVGLEIPSQNPILKSVDFR